MVDTPLSNLAIVGLDFYADTRDPDSSTLLARLAVSEFASWLMPRIS